MSAPWSCGWLAGLVACMAAAACGRIGYLPDGDAAADGPSELPGRDGSTGSGSGPDASNDADATLTTVPDAGVDATSLDSASTDATAPDSTPSNDGAPSLDALEDQGSESGSDAAEAGPDGPNIDCGAPCCCAYVCKYPVAPTASTCGGASDPARYAFESGAQGWVLSNAANMVIPGQTSVVSTPVFAGSSALMATMTVPSGSSQYIRLDSPSPFVSPGSTVTFHVWLPAGAGILAIQPYVMDVNYTFTGAYTEAAQLVLGCWSTIVVSVPTTFVEPQFEIGVQIVAPASTPYNGVAYVDAVSW